MNFRQHTGLYGQRWIAMSTCGNYAIAHDKSNPRETKFAALHIPGIWATAERIGVRKTKAEAEALCEQHLLTPPFIANRQQAQEIR